MATAYHSDSPLGENHILENWSYADATARAAASGFVSGDVGKVAYQRDDGSYWRLTATTPTWAQIGGSGGGSGDFSSNTSSSVDGEVVLFSGTGGKTGKRATGSGIAKLTSGVLGTATAGTDYESAGAASAAIASHVGAGDPHTQYALEGALGGAAALNVGTTAGTVAAGDDSRITGAAQKSANLSDLASASTARTNLGLAIGSDVQAYDADLATIAGLTATTDSFLQAKSSAWTTRTPTQVTADLIALVGDSGSGGTKGLVPAPSAGDAAAGKFLKANGTWAVPSAGTQTNSTLATAAGTATCANTTSETSITPGVSGSLTIAANTAVQYETYRFVFRGYASSNGSNSLTLKLYFGSTSVAQTTSVFMATCTNRAWEVTVDVVVTTTGASGAVWAFGTNTRFTATSTTSVCEMTGATANSTTTIDFTADQAVTLKATHSSANASNTITCTHATMTRMKS